MRWNYTAWKATIDSFDLTEKKFSEFDALQLAKKMNEFMQKEYQLHEMSQSQELQFIRDGRKICEEVRLFNVKLNHHLLFNSKSSYLSQAIRLTNEIIEWFTKNINYIFERRNDVYTNYDNFYNQLLNWVCIFSNSISKSSSLIDHILASNIQESHYRDFYRILFLHQNIKIDAESPNRVKGLSDLVINDALNEYQMTISFKVWKRNFDKIDPIIQILNEMDIHEKCGIIIMINPNKNSLDDKFNMYITQHSSYIDNTFNQIEIKNNDIFSGVYNSRTNNKKTLYFLIINLYNMTINKD